MRSLTRIPAPGFTPRGRCARVLRALPGCVLLLLPACNSGAQAGRNDRASEVITEALVRRHVGVIADDSMLGRDTPSRGLDLTAHYAAANFKRLGLRPGGDSGTFFQWYEARETTARVVHAENTVAILEGTDSLLRHEYVVFSAHMDHVGVNPVATRDSIWNGADDDASGTAGVLALAEAFAKSPARRSMIFLLVSGEEKGLWGSDWFTTHPPVPIERVVADINLDMIGRNWKDTIVAIGKQHSDLGETLDRVAAAHPELALSVIDDLWPAESFYTRSDHYNFARRGVPVLFFFNGTHADYHEASDSPDRIDAEKAARIVRLVFHLGHAIGDAAERPKWRPESYEKFVRKK